MLPKERRALVLKLAHDFMGHYSGRKIKDTINSRFTWPGLATDAEKFAASCDQCLTINKAGNRQAQLQ